MVGLGLFLAPAVVAPVWFWPLTPLLSRMTGSWLLGIAVACALVALDNDLGAAASSRPRSSRTRCCSSSCSRASVDWAAPGGWAWVATIAAMLIVNVWGYARSSSHA